MTIALFDPSIATENIGDRIIIDSILEELYNLFPEDSIVHLPTQDIIGKVSKKITVSCKHRFVGGTNLLSSQMLRFKQWKIDIFDTCILKDVTLLGVGWWQYQNSPDFYTKNLLRKVLSFEKIHAVRDEYTKLKLESIGLSNILNTGCPTMWKLTSDHCQKVPSSKAENVVFTLTDYNISPVDDVNLIKLLKNNYRKIFYWPQGSGDLNYIHSLAHSFNKADILILPQTLYSFNNLLSSEGSIDYIGTRLHGGIRALQNYRRTLILGVDNRAIEISKDTNLPVLKRESINQIEYWILNPVQLELKMDFTAINAWRNQFKCC